MHNRKKPQLSVLLSPAYNKCNKWNNALHFDFQIFPNQLPFSQSKYLAPSLIDNGGFNEYCNFVCHSPKRNQAHLNTQFLRHDPTLFHTTHGVNWP